MGRSPAARRPRALLLAAVVVVALVAALAGCSGDEAAAPSSTTGTAVPTTPPVELDEPPPEGVLRLGAVDVEHLDPAFVLPTDPSGAIAADLLFDGLTAYDPTTGTVVPALAESWSANPEQTRFRFVLRADATFADGSPVTASDVKASLERIARLGNISLAGVRLELIAGYQAMLDTVSPGLDGVVVIDDRTVDIITLEAYAPLPGLLAAPQYGIVPGVALAAGDSGDFDSAPVGSGPYAFDRRDGPTVHLVARDPAAAVGAVELVSYPTPEAAYGDFTDELLDWSVVPAGLVDEAAAAYGDGAIVPFVAELLYGFNLADEVLAEPRLRLAVARAIDRQALVDGVLEAAVPATGVVPPGVPGHVPDACGDSCRYDPEGARALLADAYPDGEIPTLRLDVFDDPVERAVADQVVADLAAVGIPVELVVTPFDAYTAVIVSGSQQLFSFSWVGVAVEPDVFLSPLFLSSSPDNVSSLADPIVDIGIKAARAESDAAARNALYGETDRLVMAQVPMVPLAVYETSAVLAERVEGYVPRPDGTFVVGELRLADGTS